MISIVVIGLGVRLCDPGGKAWRGRCIRVRRNDGSVKSRWQRVILAIVVAASVQIAGCGRGVKVSGQLGWIEVNMGAHCRGVEVKAWGG